jgi:hypothetical protein
MLMLSAVLLPELAVVNVFSTVRAVFREMESMNNDGAKAAMRIERLKKCIAENEQRNYGDEQVNRDHE